MSDTENENNSAEEKAEPAAGPEKTSSPTPAPAEQAQPLKTWDCILIGIIVAAAVIPRLWAFGSRPFSVPEANLLIQSTEPFKSIMHLMAAGGIQHTPYNLQYTLILKLWSYIGGTSEWWMRGLSFIFGLGGIFLAWKTARLFLIRRTALVAVLLTAICPFHIMFSRDVGFEALLFLLCAAMLYFFLRIYTGKAAGADYFFYFIVSALGVSLHLSAALLLLPFNILFFGWRTKSRDDLPFWISANIPLVAIFVLWAPVWKALVFYNWSLNVEMLNIFEPTMMTPTLTLAAISIVSYIYFLLTCGHYYTGLLLNVFTIPGFFLSAGVFQLALLLGFRQSEDRFKIRIFGFVMLFLAGFSGILCAYSGIPYASNELTLKFAVALIPFSITFNMLAADGLMRFASVKLKRLFWITLPLVFFGGLMSIFTVYSSLPDWRAIASELHSMNKTAAPVIVLDGWDSSALTFYSGPDAANIHALFPEFASFIPETDSGSSYNSFLQDEIVRPFRGDFDSYQDYIERQLKSSRQAWIVYEKKTMRHTPRIEAETDWIQRIKDNHGLNVEEFNFPDDVKVGRIWKKYKIQKHQITLLRITLAGGPAPAW